MRINLPRLALASLCLVLATSACGAAGTPAPGGVGFGAAGQSSASGSSVDPLVKAFKGPKVDLSGVSLTATTPEPDSLDMGSVFMFDKLRQWGANVDVVTITTTSGIQTMIAGRSNLGNHGADEVVLGDSEGANVTAIGSSRTKQSYVLVAKNDIKNVAGLKGRTIAMSGPSGFDTLLTNYDLKKAGLSGQAKLVQIGGSPDRATALLAGTVDAATIFLSDWENLKTKTNKVHLVTNFADSTSFPGDAYYLETSYLKSHQNLGLAVACANLEANQWLDSNEPQYIEFANKNIKGADQAGLKATYSAAIQAGMWPTNPAQVIDQGGLEALQQAMLDSGEITKTVPLAGAVDTSYLKKASAMGCGKSG